MNLPYSIAFPVHAMAASGNALGFKALLEQVGCDHAGEIVNSRDNRGFTALHKAMESGNLALVEMLVEYGADISAEVGGNDPKGWTALHFAAFDDHPRVIEFMVNRGAHINHPGDGNLTPLRVAVTRNNSASVKKLLILGADPFVKDAHGFTLLHEAANMGSEDIVKELLAAGCQPDAKANDGSTPAMWAKRHDNGPLVQLLEKKT